MKQKAFLILICLVISTTFLGGCLGTNFASKYGTNITEYNIKVAIEDVDKASAEQTVHYKNTSTEILNEVCFHLYPNAFAETAVNKPVSKLYEQTAYPNGKSFGGIEILDVKCHDDDCTYALENVDKDILKITLTKPLYPNDFVKIDIDFSLKIPNILHRFGYNKNTINLGNFYPVACVFDGTTWDTNSYHHNGDPFFSTMSNYNVCVTYPNQYVLAHTGNQTDTQLTEQTKVTTITATAVRDFAMVLSADFKTLYQTVDDTEIKYYYQSDQNAEQSLQTAQKALQTFNSKFGKYPYQTLSVVETGFLYGGMEFPTLVMISDNLKTYDDYTNTIVHEIAHQWWYGVVGNNQYDHAWLDESLTEYSVVVFYEQNPEYQILRDTCIKNAITSYTLFVDVYKDVFKQVDTSMNRKLDQFETEPEYVYAIYVRGMIMFDDVRNIIGDRNFFNALKTYYKKYSGKIATPESLIGVFEDVSGKKVTAIFNSYLDGSAIIGTLEN